MPRKERNCQQSESEAPRICPCGAQIEGRGDLCRKCRGRVRWLRRTNGRRRDQWREFIQSNSYFTEAVSAS
ncbi:hypothetical protein NGB36_11115 [Streptomyces sp. RB6PN25]|uniref:DUF1289 domain-containing protein n=1 Tax=Streptomyces humicola TaxID=2953240 RepID=A0ABT1PTY9_9ACTN|nr:hypothetical protein [Streptomyces humicola]MCQ4081137.1 hypothetical protein [Streptomyces humicola]